MGMEKPIKQNRPSQGRLILVVASAIVIGEIKFEFNIKLIIKLNCDLYKKK